MNFNLPTTFGPGHEHGGETVFEVWKISSTEMMIVVMFWVAISLFIFELLNWIFKERMSNAVKKAGAWQPLIATLLGLIPGCGGTLFLLPYYNRREVSFASLSASFISTMGEVAFLLLATNPMMWVWVSVVSLIVALVVGYILQWTPLGAWFERKLPPKSAKETEEYSCDCKTHSKKTSKAKSKKHSHKRTPQWYIVTDKWVMPIITAGVFIFISPIAGLSTAGKSYDFGVYNTIVDWTSFIWLNVIVLWYMIKRYILPKQYESRVHTHDNHSSSFLHHMDDVFQTLIFIATWVLYGTLLVNFSILGFGEEPVFNMFSSMGPWGQMVMALLIGLIPGCGPQILIAQLWTLGIIGSPAIFVNAITQDGDAGLPLFAYDKMSYIATQLVAVIPAFLVGMTLILIGQFAPGVLPF